MEKVGTLACCCFDPLLKALAHLAVLREDEHLAVGFETLTENLEHRVGLAGIRTKRFRLRILRRRIADLLQARDELEDKTAARHAARGRGGVGRFLGLADFLHELLEGRSIKRRLFGAHECVVVRCIFFRKIRNDRLVGLEAPQHEGRGKAPEGFRRLLIAVALNGFGKGFGEFLLRAEELRLHGRENRPVFHQAVFNGRARHGDHLIGPDAAHGGGLSCGNILDRLRLIEDEKLPADGGEHLIVAPQCAVAREKHVGRLFRSGELSVGAVVGADGEGRSELRDFARPVRDERGR